MESAEKILNNVSMKRYSPHLQMFLKGFSEFNAIIKKLPPLDPLPTKVLHWWAGGEAQLKELWEMLTKSEKKKAERHLGTQFAEMRKWGLW